MRRRMLEAGGRETATGAAIDDPWGNRLALVPGQG